MTPEYWVFHAIFTTVVEGGLPSIGLPLTFNAIPVLPQFSLLSTVCQNGDVIILNLPITVLSLLPFTMEKVLAYWWVFPVSIVFATIALASGVSGALFFSPFFMLAVGLSPAKAVGAGLMTEVAGMGNGLRSYVNQNVVDYATAKWLLLAAIPAVIIGSILSHYLDPTVLKIVFGGGLVLLGGFLIIYDAPEEYEPGEAEGAFLRRKNTGRGETVIETSDGETFRYDTCWRPPGVSLAGIGAFITGLISAGLPEVTTTQLVARCRVPPRVAVATSVFVLAITATVGAAIHAVTARPVWYVVVWSIPGVLIGSTIGTRVSKYVPSDLMETTLGIVFSGVGILVLVIQFIT